MMPAVKSPQGSGDPIFSMYDRQDRLYARLNKKIEGLEVRLAAIEERGRS